MGDRRPGGDPARRITQIDLRLRPAFKGLSEANPGWADCPVARGGSDWLACGPPNASTAESGLLGCRSGPDHVWPTLTAVTCPKGGSKSLLVDQAVGTSGDACDRMVEASQSAVRRLARWLEDATGGGEAADGRNPDMVAGVGCVDHEGGRYGDRRVGSTVENKDVPGLDL
jgi:hypothetical protein